MSMFDDYREEEATRLQPGDYRVVIIDVEEGTSKSSGNPMLIVTVQPSGANIHIKHYIVKNQYFNRNTTELFDSFGINRGNGNLLEWIGAMGAAKLIEDENGYLKVKRFLPPEKQEKLPPWEGEAPQRQQVTSELNASEADGDLPWD